MANTTSAKKAFRQSLKRNFINKSRKSTIKTFTKKFEQNLGNVSKEQAIEAFKDLQSKIMKGVKKGIINLNTASRKVSSIAKKFKLSFTTSS